MGLIEETSAFALGNYLKERKVISREKRVSTITAYQGNNQTLQDDINVTEVRQRIRTFSQSSKDEILEALKLLSKIKEAPVIIHGAIGCSAAELYFYKEEDKNTWYSTDLNERDTIMGGDEKLKKTVERAYKKYKSKVIFVVGTPVVAINNDDINSVILELEEELDTKIISIDTDGFKTKASINGIDIVLHALGRYVIQKSTDQEKEDFINLISISENKKGIEEILRLLGELEVNVNTIPQFASIDEIKKAHLAKVSIAVNDDEADILLRGILEKSQVPSIKSKVPIGISGTSSWLEELGKSIDIQDKVTTFVTKEEKRLEKYTSKQPLLGKKIFIDLPTSVAIELIGFIEELGGEVTGISISHIDNLNRDKFKVLSKEVFVKIGDGQPFELVNILLKNKPDFYIGNTDQVGLVSKLGISPISVTNKTLYGYEGAIELIRSFQKLEKRKGFVNYLSENTKLPYKETWLKKSSNWFIKQEVK